MILSQSRASIRLAAFHSAKNRYDAPIGRAYCRAPSTTILILGVLDETVDTMKTTPLRKSAAVLALSVLLAIVFHVVWVAAFVASAKSGVFALKVLGWLLAPILTALGYAMGVRLGERTCISRRNRFLQILGWPLIGCTIGAIGLCWLGPMWAGIGTFIGGAVSVAIREAKLSMVAV